MKRAICLLSVAATLASCGGDDGESSEEEGQSTALATEEFVEQADTICRDGEADVAEARAEAFPEGQATSPAAEESFNDEVLIPSIQERVDALGQLEPPTSIATAFEAYLQSLQEGLDEAVQDPGALSGPVLKPFAEAQGQAAELGLEECAS